MSVEAIGYFVTTMVVTILAAYVVLAVFLIKPLRKYKAIGLVIAAVLTGFYAYVAAIMSKGAAGGSAIGWAAGMVFITWRTSLKPKRRPGD